MTEKITQLTPAQQAMIPVYREKWKRIPISTQPIDRQKASVAVNVAYKLIGEPDPDVVFCSSPREALNAIITSKLQLHLGRRLENRLRKPLRAC